MSANNITQLVQKAATAWLQSEDLSFVTDEETQVVEGIASADIVLPQVVCQCAQAQVELPFTGNWRADLRVEVRSNVDDTTQDEHHANAGEVFGKFMTADAKGDLSAATTGFTAQWVVPQEQGWSIDEGTWVSYLVLEVFCAGSDFDVS